MQIRLQVHLKETDFFSLIRVLVGLLTATTFFSFQIHSVTVSPTVENPLIRKPVRCDIYSKAAQLHILNMPGSKVEDRQYEIVFNKISVGSGKWDEILRLMNTVRFIA